MKRIERKLAEEVVYLINNKEELKFVKEKYNNYKKWTMRMKKKGTPPSKLLNGLLNKMYINYRNER